MVFSLYSLSFYWLLDACVCVRAQMLYMCVWCSGGGDAVQSWQFAGHQGILSLDSIRKAHIVLWTSLIAKVLGSQYGAWNTMFWTGSSKIGLEDETSGNGGMVNALFCSSLAAHHPNINAAVELLKQGIFCGWCLIIWCAFWNIMYLLYRVGEIFNRNQRVRYRPTWRGSRDRWSALRAGSVLLLGISC